MIKEDKVEKEIKEKAKEFSNQAKAWGEKVGKEWEKKGEEIGQKFEKPAEYIFSIVINIILISIWGRLPEWFPWIINSFVAVLPLFYISFTATIIANLLFLLSPGRRFVAFGKLVLNIFSIIVMISLYFVYPFDFSLLANYWDQLARIVILVAIFGTAIATIVEFFNLLTGKKR